MLNYQVGLLTTFILGIFILIGAGIALLVDKKDKIVEFSIGLAFGVITTLILTDLLPEIFESLGLRHVFFFLVFTILGFFLLKGLDHFVPDHHEYSMSKKEANENLIHIGVITTFALILHNIIEGMAVYSSTLSDPSLGVMLSIGVGFHNIPLGMVIASSFYHSSLDSWKTFLSLTFVSLSTFLGGCVMYLFQIHKISDLVLGILLSLTLGMLLFILIDELIPRIKHTKQKKFSYIGIFVGILLLVISYFIG